MRLGASGGEAETCTQLSPWLMKILNGLLHLSAPMENMDAPPYAQGKAILSV